ncbi:MAG: hypothetical protein MZW92_35265 [Comamonadaceae bacterium]|nr:hypothetical protein [Comamonadaceae bacterium]
MMMGVATAGRHLDRRQLRRHGDAAAPTRSAPPRAGLGADRLHAGAPRTATSTAHAARRRAAARPHRLRQVARWRWRWRAACAAGDRVDRLGAGLPRHGHRHRQARRAAERARGAAPPARPPRPDRALLGGRLRARRARARSARSARAARCRWWSAARCSTRRRCARA